MPSRKQFIEAIAKHLPPSSSQLRMLDIGMVTGEILSVLRPDLVPVGESVLVQSWAIQPDSLDAAVGFDLLINDEFLTKIFIGMRPGGRMIVVNPAGKVDEVLVRQLESLGFVRILVEPAVSGEGVLIRGEKPHLTEDTHARVRGVAQQDETGLVLSDYRGRFLYLLVQQSPNKPVWKLAADEQISWQAIAVEQPEGRTLLTFSSLPRAVAFMQQAVLKNHIRDVNKVPKFARDTVVSWNFPVLVNPELAFIQHAVVSAFLVDPAQAEAPDE